MRFHASVNEPRLNNTTGYLVNCVTPCSTRVTIGQYSPVTSHLACLLGRHQSITLASCWQYHRARDWRDTYASSPKHSVYFIKQVYNCRLPTGMSADIVMSQTSLALSHSCFQLLAPRPWGRGVDDVPPTATITSWYHNAILNYSPPRAALLTTRLCGFDTLKISIRDAFLGRSVRRCLFHRMNVCMYVTS